MNIIIGILLLLILTANDNAQTIRTAARSKPKPSPAKPCTLSKEDKISLRGFYLGQNKDELSYLPNFDSVYERYATPSVLPLSSLGLVQLEDQDFRQTSSNGSLGDEYKDVGFALHFLDGKIIFVGVDYYGYEPANLSIFIKQISDTTPLPIDSWVITDRTRAIMKCVDFEVYAFKNSYSPPSIHMNDSVAEKELERRAEESERTRAEAERERKRIELERKRTFKP